MKDATAAPYAARRDALYTPLQQEGVFTWDTMYGEEYALATAHTITPAFCAELRTATQQLGQVFTRTVAILQQGDDELLAELGLPPEAWRAMRVRVPLGGPTLIGRFDFAQTTAGLKMLELNSDTPTSIVEAYHVNGRACQFFHLQDPNAGLAEQHLRPALQRLVRTYRKQGYPVEHICFSSLDWHEEDAGTTRYLLAQSGLPGRFAPLSDLRVQDDRLWMVAPDAPDTLHPVDVLYRLHALEKLVEDRDVDGYPTGAVVLDLIARERVALINPPSGFLAQTKALQALIWSLYEADEFYTEEERAAIGRYMLPTYLEDRFTGHRPFVTKPIFGREGGAVTLHDAAGTVEERDGETAYWEQMMIYQERVELEEVEVETLRGPYRGRLLWGSFLIDGQPSALVARIGGAITGNLSYYLPVGLAR